jgi:hypothetical protein
VPAVATLVKFGLVVGHFTSFKEDGFDPGNVPDEVPANGTGRAVPNVSQFKVAGSTPPTWVAVRPVSFKVADGVLLSQNDLPLYLLASEQPAGDVDHIQWTMTFDLDTPTQPATVVFDVVDGGTTDVSQVVPAVPVPGTVPVYTNGPFVKTVNGVAPDENGNVVAAGGGGGTGDVTQVYVDAADAALQASIDDLEAWSVTADGELTSLASADTAIDIRLDALEMSADSDDARLDALEPRVTAVEGVNTTQNTRLTAAEAAILTKLQVVKYASGAWPDRPTSNAAITYAWFDPDGGHGMPPQFIAGSDVLWQPDVI